MSNSIMYSDIYPFIIDNVLAKGVEFDNTMNSNNAECEFLPNTAVFINKIKSHRTPVRYGVL